MHPYKKYMFILISSFAFSLVVSGKSAAVSFEQTPACITTAFVQMQDKKEHNLMVEVANTNKKRARGLMERNSLGDFQGMIFIYPNAAVRGFWMFQTHIALDIAYMNAEGEVLETLQMQPCASRRSFECPSYAPKEPFTMALEMAAGRFSTLGITAGSQFNLGTCQRQE